MFSKIKILYHNILAFITVWLGSEENSSKHFLKAATLGSPFSQIMIGTRYDEGRGVKKDGEKAFYWFKEAAKQENIYGLANVGMSYYYGKGVSQDFKESFIWLQKAAVKGDPESQYNLGYMYATGEGVNKDINQAIKWFTEAKSNKFNKAAEILDEIYKGTFQDIDINEIKLKKDT